MDRVLKWKVGSQYGRVAWLWEGTSPRTVETLTQEAVSAEDRDWESLFARRVQTLMKMRGVGIGIASAALALVLPDEYAVIDFRGWRQLFGEERRSFSVNDYKRYMKAVRGLAGQLGWPPQEVDLAVWERDRRMYPVLRRSAHS